MPDSIPLEHIGLLFSARSVAVVGASGTPEKPGGQTVPALVRMSYPGAIYPINPRRQQIKRLTCYPTLSACPQPAELAVIALPAEQVLEAVEECARLGIKAVVVLSSGFAECGPEGALLQAKLAEAAHRHWLALCGPNCMGVISAPERLMANFLVIELPQGLPRPNHISIISQSGSLGAALAEMLAQRGIGLCRMVSSGNEAVLDFADYLDYLAQDQLTSIIAGYLEGLPDPDKLERALARAAKAGKPVLIIKAGQSDPAAAAALRHTGHDVGRHDLYSDIFRRQGVISCSGLNDLCTAASLLATEKSFGLLRVGVLSPFGGAGVMLCDQLQRAGAPLAQLAESTSRRLSALLPAFASAVNPVDLTPQVMNRAEVMAGCASLLLSDPGVDVLINCTWIWEGFAEQQLSALRQMSESSPKPVVHLIWGNDPCAAQTLSQLQRAGLPAEGDSQVIAQALGLLARSYQTAQN